MRKDYLPDKFI